LHTPTQYCRAKKPFFGGLVKYFCAGPIVAMCWEGLGVIATGRLLLGATNPKVM
jgi:nucleoside-diphosphate kinase